jgi:hypothetical protein
LLVTVKGDRYWDGWVSWAGLVRRFGGSPVVAVDVPKAMRADGANSRYSGKGPEERGSEPPDPKRNHGARIARPVFFPKKGKMDFRFQPGSMALSSSRSVAE